MHNTLARISLPILLVTAVVSVWHWSCSHKPTEFSAGGPVQLAVDLQGAYPKLLAAAKQYEVLVYDEAGALVTSAALRVEGARLVGTLTGLPTGVPLTFVARVSSDGVIFYEGSVVGTIDASQVLAIAIRLRPTVPLLAVWPPFVQVNAADSALNLKVRAFQLPGLCGVKISLQWPSDAVLAPQLIPGNENVLLSRDSLSGNIQYLSVASKDGQTPMVDSVGDGTLIELNFRRRPAAITDTALVVLDTIAGTWHWCGNPPDIAAIWEDNSRAVLNGPHGAAVLSVAPTNLKFTAYENGPAPEDIPFTITNTGGEALPWTISEDAAWLSVTPTTGTLMPASSTTCTAHVSVAGLAPDEYSAQLEITGNAANSPLHVPVSCSVASLVPLHLSCRVIYSSSIELTWDAPAHEVAGYQVFRDNALVAEAVHTTSYTDTPLELCHTYEYKVRSYASSGYQSGFSEAITCQLDLGIGPMDLKCAAVDSTTIDLTWKEPTSCSAVAHYEVVRNGVVVGAAEGTSYTDRNLAPCTQYCYEIRAVLVSQRTARGDTTCCRTADRAPSIVSQLACQSADSVISLTWSASDGCHPIAWYRVYRNEAVLDSTAGLSYADTGVTYDTNYCYQVVAVDSIGLQSSPGNSVCCQLENPRRLCINPSTWQLPCEGDGTTWVTVKNCDDTAASYSYWVGEDCDWLAVSPLEGTTPGGFRINGLGYRNYSNSTRRCEIIVTAPDAENSPETLVVTQASCLQLCVYPDSILMPWHGDASFVVNVNDCTGYGKFSYTVSEGCSWLSVYPSSGTAPGSFDVSGGSANEGTTTRECIITVTASGVPGSPKRIKVVQPPGGEW